MNGSSFIDRGRVSTWEEVDDRSRLSGETHHEVFSTSALWSTRDTAIRFDRMCNSLTSGSQSLDIASTFSISTLRLQIKAFSRRLMASETSPFVAHISMRRYRRSLVPVRNLKVSCELIQRESSLSQAYLSIVSLDCASVNGYL